MAKIKEKTKEKARIKPELNKEKENKAGEIEFDWEKNMINMQRNKVVPKLILFIKFRNTISTFGWVGWRVVREEKQNNKIIFWGLVLLGRYSLGRGSPFAVHSNWKCKNLKISTCHDGKVTLTFNLT